jgi:hypothetical protein
MAKPKSTVRKGVRIVAGKPVVVTTKPSKGLIGKALKKIGK